MRRIIVLDDEGMGNEPLGWEALAELGETRQYRQTPAEQVARRIGQSEIVLTNKAVIDRTVMDACPGMRYIGVLSTRYNVVDIEAAQERGIVVTNIPAYSTYAVVQHSMALLLEVCNHVHLHNEAVKAGRSPQSGYRGRIYKRRPAYNSIWSWRCRNRYYRTWINWWF